MTLEEIKSKLCFYDQRNPYTLFDPCEPESQPIDCSCDNCFYDRTELAEEILMLKAELSTIQQSLKKHMSKHQIRK